MPKSVLGYSCILVCVCEYTNWIKAIPLVKQEAGTIADAIFFRIICEYGTPKAVICDEGPAFTSDLMKMYFHAMKTYKKNTQWIREMRKYPDHETFAVGDLVLVYHPIGSVLNSPSRKLNRNWVGPLRIQTVLDKTHYLCSDWSGILVPKRFHINRLKQYYMNLGEIGENGKLKIVQNVNELYDIWQELKEDEKPKESTKNETEK